MTPSVLELRALLAVARRDAIGSVLDGDRVEIEVVTGGVDGASDWVPAGERHAVLLRLGENRTAITETGADALAGFAALLQDRIVDESGAPWPEAPGVGVLDGGVIDGVAVWHRGGRPVCRIGELRRWLARATGSHGSPDAPRATMRPIGPVDDHAGYGDPGQYLRSVVRLFTGWAESPIWFVDGPVDLAETRLDPSLCVALDQWNRDFEAGLDERTERRTPQLEAEHKARGTVLADRLVAELGDAFEVQADGPGGAGRRLIRGVGPGENPAAVAAFRRWAAESEFDDARFEILRAAGITLDVFPTRGDGASR